MNSKAKVTALVLGGYMLGRSKKLKLALTVAASMSGSALYRNREQIQETLSGLGASSPELKDLQDKLTGRLSEAVQSSVATGLDQVGAKLQEKTDAINSSLDAVPGAESEDEEGSEEAEADKSDSSEGEEDEPAAEDSVEEETEAEPSEDSAEEKSSGEEAEEESSEEEPKAEEKPKPKQKSSSKSGGSRSTSQSRSQAKGSSAKSSGSSGSRKSSSSSTSRKSASSKGRGLRNERSGYLRQP